MYTTQNPTVLPQYFSAYPTFSTAAYWEFRYTNGGDSGSGSYGRLARFKADTINAFIQSHRIDTIVEFGCGDGHQLSLAEYPLYIGVDISPTAVGRCQTRFNTDPNKFFYTLPDFEEQLSFYNADVTMSLDVIYHLVEDKLFDAYMHRLFKHARSYVIIYANDVDVQKTEHIRYRKFSRWVHDNVADQWQLVQKIPNRYPFLGKDHFETSISDFYIYRKCN